MQADGHSTNPADVMYHAPGALWPTTADVLAVFPGLHDRGPSDGGDQPPSQPTTQGGKAGKPPGGKAGKHHKQRGKPH